MNCFGRVFFACLCLLASRNLLLADDGVLPVGADGKPLNFDFETGTLKDWIAEGDAFAGQPIKGDTVYPRRNDMRSQHQGQYWIGTYERAGDKPTGTLTSVPFKVTHPWASFQVGGGPYANTCVEILRNDTKQLIARVSGLEEENLRRVAVDLRPHQGKEIIVRLVDRHTGHWGHLNFDDFRFHASQPNYPQRQAPPPPPTPDQYAYAGLPPEKAAQVMTVPLGFQVKLFAGEPDVHQPIAMCLDDRGRVWIAEAYCYPNRRADKDANDRIVIFEDTDGDGHFDKRTVFMEGLNLISGLEVGFGGVWIGAAPYLMFVPMQEGADKPSGPPQILLDGWAYQDTHETLNTFTWGPDGWLYGCHGVFTHSRVGKPGTPNAQRIPINAGIWRYHPTKHIFEVFAEGTSNPWGFDFDERGQAFNEACVIPHAFHIIQGGRYLRQAGNHFNPYTYADIQTIADHFHYVGPNPHGGNNVSDKAGGGHAHCGLMIYQGDAWPAEYRGQMFMGNIHGRRLNMDILKAQGSGYVAGHGPDFLLANDAWARFINFRYGPDGNVYMIDWYDKQACHRPEPEIWDRSNGRIYKIVYRGTKPVQVDLKKLNDKELVDLQLHRNEWYVRHARRILQERGGNPAVHEALAKIAFDHPEVPRRLRGLWALHATGGLTEERLMRALNDLNPFVRGWAIQLAFEDRKPSDQLLARCASLADADSSPVLRKYLASGAIRLPLEQRWSIVEGLLRHPEDASDHNLPFLYWYALEPLAGLDPSRALTLARHAPPAMPLLNFMVRRIGSAGTAEALELIVNRLESVQDGPSQLAILRGLSEALRGRKSVSMPGSWPKVSDLLRQSKLSEVRTSALTLGVTFGDSGAFGTLRTIVTDPKATFQDRREALASLLAARDPQLPPVLHHLVSDPDLRGDALRGLAVYNDEKTPAVVLGAYKSLNAAEKRDALNTLASRARYGKALMEAVAVKQIPAADVPADLVRQLRNLKDKELDQRIADVWGVVRATAADRRQMQTQMKRMLQKPGPAPDLALGRALYVKTCGQCHVLFGDGGKVGPELTGSNRANLDYLLENILDPSAVIPKEYATTLLELNNGRLITGIVKSETPAAVTVVTATETLTVPHNEIASRHLTEQSMMPEDQLKPMSEPEIRSLIAYLQSPVQTPLLATPDNVKDFFNGKDLTGWNGNMSLWRVENGEIVGSTKGLKKNEFLKSQMAVSDFRLAVKVKLVPNKENSGIQFRSEALPDGEMRGPQADIGAGWWGKLYEESARGLLWKESGEQHVKVDDWNEYVVEAVGDHIRTWINGKLCVDLKDDKIAKRGIFGLQLHAGGPMEVRFKDLKLELLTK